MNLGKLCGRYLIYSGDRLPLYVAHKCSQYEYLYLVLQIFNYQLLMNCILKNELVSFAEQEYIWQKLILFSIQMFVPFYLICASLFSKLCLLFNLIRQCKSAHGHAPILKEGNKVLCQKKCSL